MKFDYRHAGLQREDLEKHTRELESYRKHLRQVAKDGGYDTEECSLNLPFDKSIVSAISLILQKKHSTELKFIIVVGIGGSNLGAQAIYDSLFGFFDAIDTDRFPKLLFLDTNSSAYLKHFELFLDVHITSPEEILVNMVSKSGETTETLANIEFIFAFLKKKFGIEKAKSRIVVTTDVDSKLWISAEEEGIDHLAVPSLVGGRFSVFSAVGMFPLALLGIDIEVFLKGARNMREQTLNDENDAMQSAIVLYQGLKKGKTINDNFFFNPELESLGKWYRQLMAESLGKEKDGEGNVVHAGMTPTVSIGSTDVHSVGQLNLGGPKDKITTFIYSDAKESEKIDIPKDRLFSELDPMIGGRSMNDIMQAIYEGTKAAYIREELPFMEIVFDNINEEELGAFLQFKMMEMMYLGKLLNVNIFDEPQVKLFKEETKKVLEK